MKPKRKFILLIYYYILYSEYFIVFQYHRKWVKQAQRGDNLNIKSLLRTTTIICLSSKRRYRATQPKFIQLINEP